MILACGATGVLGAAVVRELQRLGAPVRALVRPASAGGRIEGAEVVPGDFRDPSSLRRAVDGVDTVVSSVTVIARILAGERDTGFDRVDRDGHRALIEAAEAAGVARFVFVSAVRVRDEPWASTPIGVAKVATEDRLLGSVMRSVVIRPDQFQELWLSPTAQFDWPRRRVVVFGRGETPNRYVATDDAAAAVARLAVAADPPPLVEFGGPEALTCRQAVEVFEDVLGEPIKVRHVPRVALRLGTVGLRRLRPAVASVMGGALAADLLPPTWDDRPLRDLGIAPRSVREYAEQVTRAPAGGA